MTVSFEQTALVVVDMQYGDAHRDFGLLKSKREAGQTAVVEAYASRLEQLVVPNIQRLQTAFRAHGGEVIFVRIESLTQNGRERSAEHRAKDIHFAPGSKEGAILDEIGPCGDELVLSKTCGSAFRGTSIEYLLRNMQRSHVVVVGVVTGSCVQATSCDALERGFATLVVEDATATWSPEKQASALALMRGRGADVVSTEQLLTRLKADVPERDTRRIGQPLRTAL
jgi:nicotinamidase-related amidase